MKIPSKMFVLMGSAIIGSLVTGCAELNDPYYGGGYGNRPAPPYYGGGYGGYGGGYNDPYYYDRERDRARDERQRLERERERLERERERYEREQASRPTYRPPPPPRDEGCPPGFRETYGGPKCSDAERRRGCQDIRTPSGRTCRRG